MKHLTLTFAGILVLAGTLLAGGWTVAAGSPSISASGRHVRVTSIYQTTDSPSDVLAGYGSRYQPESGRHKTGECILLRSTGRYVIFHQNMLVTLCPVDHGTRAILDRDLIWGR